MNPLFIIADEPTGNPDSTNGDTIMNLLLSCQTEFPSNYNLSDTQSRIHIPTRIICSRFKMDRLKIFQVAIHRKSWMY